MLRKSAPVELSCRKKYASHGVALHVLCGIMVDTALRPVSSRVVSKRICRAGYVICHEQTYLLDSHRLGICWTNRNYLLHTKDMSTDLLVGPY